MQETIKVPKRFWEDEEWAEEHMAELQQKYSEKWVAVVNKKIVGVGEGAGLAREIAQKKTGIKEFIPVIFVESGQNLY